MTTVATLTPQALAEACAEALWSSDSTSQRLGMRIERIAPGEATLSMEITDFMLNGHGLAHGGFVFALADSAFAFACNGYNQRTVGYQAAITYVAPGRLGDRLTAVARELWRGNRDGIYDVNVTNDRGEPVAEFRGHSRTVKGTHLPE
jgi:acyl-CoA thioesterase